MNKAIMARIRDTGEHPADLGRRGGLKAGRIKRKAKAFREWNDQAGKAWWNNERS